MAFSHVDIDEPLTPLGRQFVQPQMGLITYSILTCELPLDVSAIRTLLQSSPFFLTHPRLTSLLVKNSSGREFWHKTKLNLDDHLIIRHHPISENPDDDVNDYIGDLCSTPLSTDKPLWEVHLLMSHNTVIFRIHHAIGDGISIVSLLMSMCRRVNDPTQQPSVGMVARAKMQKRWWSVVWRFMKVVWFAVVYAIQFLLWVSILKDRASAVHGGDGVELRRRKVVTARFRMEDMKLVKGAVPKATINDVLLGIVSSGLSRYLEMRRSPTDKNHVPLEDLQVTGIEMVNLRREEGLQEMSKLMKKNSRAPWGNKFAYLLIPIPYHRRGSDPIQAVRRAKALMKNKRLPLKTRFSSKVLDFATILFGFKLFTYLIHRLLCRTSFTISNVVGPREKMSFAGNTVKSYKATVSNMPHAIVMHFVSYAGVVDMQIQVLRDVIPDPKELAKCFEDALMEMKKAATVEIVVKSV